MANKKSELQKLLEEVAQHNRCGYGKSQLKSFNQKLYESFGVGVDHLKVQKINDIKEVNKLKEVKMLLFIKYNFSTAVLTNSDSKIHHYSIGYYQYSTVRLKKGLEEGGYLYIVYCDDEEEKNRIAKLKNQRALNKKSSDLDYKSIFYRDIKRNYGGRKDKSSYRNQIEKLYNKTFEKFLNGNFEDIVNYVTNKELRLFKDYQTARNQAFINAKRDVNVSGYSIPNFDYSLKSIREQFLILKDKENMARKNAEKFPNRTYEEHLADIENWYTSEYNRYFLEIIEKEQDFRREINRMISWNAKN